MQNSYVKSAVLAAVVAGVAVAAPLSSAFAGADFSQSKIMPADHSGLFIVDYVTSSQKAGVNAPLNTEQGKVSKIALGTSTDDSSPFIVDYVVNSQKAGVKAPVSKEKVNLKLGVPSDDSSPFIVDYVTAG